jgi:hypothetical protein
VQAFERVPAVLHGFEAGLGAELVSTANFVWRLAPFTRKPLAVDFRLSQQLVDLSN